MKKPDFEAFLLGAYQSLVLGVMMKFYSVVAGFAQAVPFIMGLALTGFALGARPGRKEKKPERVEAAFAVSAALLCFVFASNLYFLNLFRIYFLGEKPFAGIALFVASVWLVCRLFSFAGWRYSILLGEAQRPVVNYACLAAGFAVGTVLFGLGVAAAGPLMMMIASLAAGLIFVKSARVRRLCVVLFVALAVTGGFMREKRFEKISFIWGIKYYERAASLWSPYYKIDIVTFKKGSALCGLYNYTGMLMATRDFEDMRAAAYYNEELYKAVMPEGAASALIVGSGGGMNHPALFPKTMKHVTAVELDPGIVSLMKGRFREYNRGFYSDRRVTPVVSEGRAYMARNHAKYDFIEYESLDTRLYAAGMSVVPIENTLFTREALALALERLSDNGVMRITIGTDDDRNVVSPIVSGLPPGAFFDVYRVYIDLGKLTGITGFARNSPLAGWKGLMPQTAIIVSRNKNNLMKVEKWYDSQRDRAEGRIKQIRVLPDRSAAITDNRPFISRGSARPLPVIIIPAALFLLFAALFRHRHPAGRMHYCFYFIGAGYAGLEILLVARGVRASTNPALFSLALVSVLLFGNSAACMFVDRVKMKKSVALAALVLLAVLIYCSARLAGSPGMALLAALCGGFLGGFFWPAALAGVQDGARRGALSSDALGALPGIIMFHILLFVSGFAAAGIMIAAFYAMAVVILTLSPGSNNTPG